MSPFQEYAYQLGRGLAFEKYAVGKEDSGGAPSWLPWAVGAGLGLGTYGLMRLRSLADPKKYPALRKIQNMAKGEMTRLPTITGKERILKNLAGTAKEPKAVWHGYRKRPQKGTFDPSTGPGTGRKAEREYRLQHRLEDKTRQARLLHKYAPGTMARSYSMQEIAKEYGIKLNQGTMQRDLQRLQEALADKFKGTDYIIKQRGVRRGGSPASGSALGTFPTSKTDLYKEHLDYQKIRGEFLDATNEDATVAMHNYAKTRGIKGRLVDEMLHNNVTFQEKIPFDRFSRAGRRGGATTPYGEYRVHVVGGKAIPSMAMPRGTVPVHRALDEYARARELAKRVQTEVLDKLPANYRNTSYGMDVGTLNQGRDFRIIEMNPGGQSGLLDAPLMESKLYRAVTGRSTPLVAAATGLGVGAVGGAMTSPLTLNQRG